MGGRIGLVLKIPSQMEWHRNALKSYKWWLDWPGSYLERFLSKREVDLNTLPYGLIEKTLCKETTVLMLAYISIKGLE